MQDVLILQCENERLKKKIEFLQNMPAVHDGKSHSNPESFFLLEGSELTMYNNSYILVSDLGSLKTLSASLVEVFSSLKKDMEVTRHHRSSSTSSHSHRSGSSAFKHQHSSIKDKPHGTGKDSISCRSPSSHTLSSSSNPKPAVPSSKEQPDMSVTGETIPNSNQVSFY